MQRELVVLSHLRWDWVWQRPQHLISRIGRGMHRTVFVEEPVAAPVDAPALSCRCEGAFERVWLEVPDPGRHVGFDFPYVESYRRELRRHLGPSRGERVVWLYTPLALHAALALQPTVLVYDVMDDLASFKDASPALVESNRQALARADVVFTGGRSLHDGVVALGRPDAHLHPSGVDASHYRPSRRRAVRSARPVAGYVGVIDERLDYELLAGLADELCDWQIKMVGPVAKVGLDELPRRPNLEFVGPQPYERLPAIVAGFDVALMPFADNQSTRSISPTKTLEYLAAGLPVVSTPVPDVAAAFAGVVDIRSGLPAFADACRAARLRRDQPLELGDLLQRHDWDAIATQMAATVADAARRGELTA